eukprot:365166-Chlamydomonas_euryale.AAC.11
MAPRATLEHGCTKRCPHSDTTTRNQVDTTYAAGSHEFPGRCASDRPTPTSTSCRCACALSNLAPPQPMNSRSGSILTHVKSLRADRHACYSARMITHLSACSDSLAAYRKPSRCDIVAVVCTTTGMGEFGRRGGRMRDTRADGRFQAWMGSTSSGVGWQCECQARAERDGWADAGWAFDAPHLHDLPCEQRGAGCATHTTWPGCGLGHAPAALQTRRDGAARLTDARGVRG